MALNIGSLISLSSMSWSCRESSRAETTVCIQDNGSISTRLNRPSFLHRFKFVILSAASEHAARNRRIPAPPVVTGVPPK